MKKITLAVFALLASQPIVARAQVKASAQLVGSALTDDRAYDLVEELVDTVGARPAGSDAAAKAVIWALHTMQSLGFKNVHTEPVKVPKWTRGEESVVLLTPIERTLHAGALGGSVGTPTGGISGSIVEVTSIDELTKLGEGARGKIIFFDKPMERASDFAGYDSVVGIRSHGAVAAAKLGAVAVLYRSAGTGRGQVVHTGRMLYEEGVPKIPMSALSLEDADLLHRLLARRAPVTVRMKLGASDQGMVDSANVVGEIPGHTNQIVLVGCHLDSWDIGTGAIDDGAGCAIVLAAAHLLTELKDKPLRTIRIVLYMNEEYGLSGAKAYAEKHKDEIKRHVAALEADAGAGRASGVYIAGDDNAVATMRKIIAPLATIGVTQVKKTEEAGADLLPIQNGEGPFVAALMQDMSGYFDWHHSDSDTLDKIDPASLAQDVAAFAVVTYGLAELPQRLRPSPKAKF